MRNPWLRVILLAALAAAVWALAKYGEAMPAVVPADAPATQFSAMRAEQVLARLLGPEVPHPASTPANAAVRARIIQAFAELGITAGTYTGQGCFIEKHGASLACATVTDVIAPVLPGTGKAIVMLAHYDSVPAGPGAADDESSVAAILEAARALRARGGKTLHPVLAVITDGEEYDLLGAAAFLDNPALKARVGAVVNAEARGNQGQSRLFQTSPGAAGLIDLYADHLGTYATSSLYAEIYKFMPNDTDLTLFIRDGFPSVNFAFADNVAHYHTPLDNRRDLSVASLQQQGDNILAMTAALAMTPYAALKTHDDVYLDIFGRFLPRMPQSWALPLSLVLLVLLALAVALNRGERTTLGEGLRAAAIFPVLLIVSGLLGWLLVFVAQTISGQSDPAYAHPLALRCALALAVLTVTLPVSRLAGLRASAAAVWLWLAALGVAAAALLPGISPYFLLPVLVATVLLLATVRAGWESQAGEGALLLSALTALVIWLPLCVAGETLMGLRAFPLFTVPAAVAAATLTPLLATRRLPFSAAGIGLAGALIAAGSAGFMPAYSAIAPQRLNLNYVYDIASGKAVWAADAAAPLPASLRAAAPFSAKPEKPYAASWARAFLAPAPKGDLQLPGAAIVTNQLDGKLRRVTLALSGSPQAAMMWLLVPGKAGLRHVILGGKAIAAPPSWAKDKRVGIYCMSSDCAQSAITLTMADKAPLELTLIERRVGLPASGVKLLAARPKTAVPSQFGDGTMLVRRIAVPAP
ncbi:MAG: M20/M25/M40 family metallo-hydrolase [Alphaproteobacteria bacterium]|nr:M20/M25/M40 family metallo-hydrolase [Alphaproteobacteria bacterium]